MSDASGLAVGDTAPEFVAPLVRPGGGTEQTRLSTLLDEAPVLLCFYTNDFTPDCTGEWCEFRDYDWFDDAEGNVQIVGASKSRPLTHKTFMSTFGLDFPLISDPELDLAEAFDVKYRTFKLFPRSKRSCFLIDRDRTVRYKWVGEHPLDPTMDTPPVEEVYRAVRQELEDAELQPRPAEEREGFGDDDWSF
ncbi:peroxiredoxin [Haloarchaeobius amylolyticus]|uniref:peroxiredoxin n=1 Tax=Haloarchaeobius amylolyticus TaxID=1198296 RepID=UPI00227031B7|nr:redoxin domain-containing protein [Haloarchaeobius amylolyticus]